MNQPYLVVKRILQSTHHHTFNNQLKRMESYNEKYRGYYLLNPLKNHISTHFSICENGKETPTSLTNKREFFFSV